MHGSARPDVDGLDSCPLRGHAADRHLRRHAADRGLYLGYRGQLRLTGVPHGTITPRSGARIPVTQQPLSAPATLRDPGQTTDMALFALAPVALDSVGLRIKLGPIMVERELFRKRVRSWRRGCPCCKGRGLSRETVQPSAV